jgi:GxxExxY protein
MVDVDAERGRINSITEEIIGAAISVHRVLGPRLLESAYEECLCSELSQAGPAFERQVALPVQYKKVILDFGYRVDVFVENTVIVEIRAVERLHPVHEAQLLSHLKLTGVGVGLLMNFHVPVLKTGLKRIVNNF